MTAKVQDVLKANLVLVGVGLINNREELEEFDRAVNSEIRIDGGGMMVNAQAMMTEPVRAITIPKDRISLELSPTRSVISRDYPLRDDLNRLAMVAGRAINSTDLNASKPRAFGFNIELVYDQDSEAPAFGYLAERIFAHDFPINKEWKLIGGAGRLLFNNREGNVWTVNVEPRFNDQSTTKVFLTLNLHVDQQRLPNEDEISRFFLEVWDQAYSLAEMIDKHDRN